MIISDVIKKTSHYRKLLGSFSAILVLSSALSVQKVKANEEEFHDEPPLPYSYSFAGNFLAANHAAMGFDAPSAANFFTASLLFDRDNPALLSRIVFFNLIAGDYEAARPYAVELVESQYPGRSEAELFLILDDAKNERYQAALTASELILNNKDSGEINLITVFSADLFKAWSLVGMGKGKQGIDHLLGDNQLQEISFFRYYQVALMAEFIGENDIAEENYLKAIDANPYSPRVANAYSRFLAHTQGIEAAKNHLKDYLESIGGAPSEAFTELLEDLQNNRMPARYMTSVQHGFKEAILQLAEILQVQGTDPYVTLFYSFSNMMIENDGESLVQLGNLFQKNGQNTLAIERFSSVKPSDPYWRRAQLELATTYQNIDQIEQAEMILENLITSFPEDAGLRIALGATYRIEERYEDSILQYIEALKLVEEGKPENWALHYELGISYERSKQWPLAERHFKIALRLNPSSARVKNYLGYSWIDLGMNYSEALNLIKEAVEAEPRAGYIIDSLGWAYYKLERYEEAVEALERAVSLDSGDPTLNDHLGDAYWKVDRKREAKFQWNHALALDPDDEMRQKIERKIEIGLDAFDKEQENLIIEAGNSTSIENAL